MKQNYPMIGIMLTFSLAAGGIARAETPPLPPPPNNQARESQPAPRIILPNRRDAKVGLRLLDEEGRPLSGLPCGVGFSVDGDNHKFIPRKGVSDKSGMFVAEGTKVTGVGVGAEPPGYYMSTKAVEFKAVEEGKLQPWGKIHDLVLKKIGKPVPMYAIRDLELELPAIGNFGFDLEQRDWIAPHGRGMRNDILFNLEKVETPFGGTVKLTLSFPSPGDGIIPLAELKGAESDLRLPREAPNEGYQGKHTIEAEWTGGLQPRTTRNVMLGYLLRVRTLLDDKGQVIKCLYGKIDGEFQFDPDRSQTAKVKFSYYLNPDGTRNLEFDRSKNLFKNLPDWQRVKRP